MEFLKKYQYTLILGIMSLCILCTGLIPYGAKVLHRCVVAPQQYQQLWGEVVEMKEYRNARGQVSYDVYLRLQLQEQEHIARLDTYVSGMELGTEILVYCHEDFPETVTQGWYEWQQCILSGGFAFFGFSAAKLMTQPSSPPYQHRKPRSLRERLSESPRV